MIKDLEEKLHKLTAELESIKKQMGNMDNEIRGVLKSEIQDNSTMMYQSEMQFGMYTALCVETIDIWKQNRIRYFSPHFHNPQTPIKKLPWAAAISAMGGFDDCGLNWVPPPGSTVCLIFEVGNRQNAYYIGTTWSRDRGPEGQHNFGVNIPEYYKFYQGHRKGYLVGPNDESQVYPPWNTESYNGFDITSPSDFADKPEIQKNITAPHIFGFKTPEKHMVKMHDGDPKCNRRWKRVEIMSGCGNWLMLKDDHVHYAGQWAHPTCNDGSDGDVSCTEGISQTPDIDRTKGLQNLNSDELNLLQNELNIQNISPIDGTKKESTECKHNASNDKIIGGHPSTSDSNSKYIKSQKGANPYFKNQNECRPYTGPGTPQNNKVDLPQSGIQLMSISGHTLVMDDSVEEPSGNPEWERSLTSFDFGCNNKYVGRTYWKSATGHLIEMNDVEGPIGDAGKQLRGEDNGITLKTATGNSLKMSDHTEPEKDCPGCPPNVAGEKRGITMKTTSNHSFEMIDWANEQCSPCRKEGGEPDAKAKKAFVRIRTGYGLEFLMKDESSQKETQTQHIQIYCPHSNNAERGPHIHRFQESATGPGLVFLRVGGNYVTTTYDNHFTVVGDMESNPANKVEIISKTKFVYTKDNYINVSDNLHLLYNKNVILLLAGQECGEGITGCDCGGTNPCIGPVLVYDSCNNVVRISSKIIGSYSQKDSCCTIVPFISGKKCPGC